MWRELAQANPLATLALIVLGLALIFGLLAASADAFARWAEPEDE